MIARPIQVRESQPAQGIGWALILSFPFWVLVLSIAALVVAR